MKTLQDRVVHFLTEALHYHEVPSNSRKYRKFEKGGKSSYFFVGRNGAVRAGKSISNSISLTSFAHRQMEAWEKGRAI